MHAGLAKATISTIAFSCQVVSCLRTGTKGSTDTGTAEQLLGKIDEIFRETKS
jgi:hypothetical protein